MAVYKGNKSGKPAAFKKTGGATPKSVTVDPKSPGKQRKLNLDMQSKSYSGAKPQKAKTIATDTKNYNKQQLDNIKQLASMKYTDGDNPYKGGKKG